MGEYNGVILLTLIGFLALAALLLTPVYRFLKREEKAAEAWTEDPYPSARPDHLDHPDHPPDESSGDESADGGDEPT